MAPLLLVFSISGILQAKLRRDLKFKGFAFASIFATILGAIVAAVMALMGFEVWSLIGQQWAYALASTAMFLAYARWLPRLMIKKAHIERLAGFSFNTIGAALLRFSIRQLDLLFLGHPPPLEAGRPLLPGNTHLKHGRPAHLLFDPAPGPPGPRQAAE